MKSNNKPKQSTSNKKRIIGDSSSRLVAGTLLGFIKCVRRCSSKILITALLAIACIPALSISSNAHATASSLSVSVSAGQGPSVNVAPTADGRFIASGTTTFSVETTHAAGYTVTAKSTALKDSSNSDTNTNTISTLALPSGTSGITADNYNDSEYASGNSLNNTWGYLPSKICTTNASTSTTTCATNTLYLPAPTSSTQTLDEVNGATNNAYDINIGTRVTTDTAQGTYATTFTVAVIGNATPYAITYNSNTTDTVSNMPTNHTTSDTGASGETVTLATNTPTRTGYTFQGWCTATPTTSGGVDSCSGTKYSAGGSWALDQTSTTNSLTLYAMWNRASYSVKVNFAGSGVSKVAFTASGYTTRNVTTSGGTASLMYGVRYTVTMSFSSTSYAFSKWALNNSSYGTLSSTSTNPTYFTPNTSSASAIITATGKSNVTYIQNFTKANCKSLASSANYTVTDSRDNNTYTVRYINNNCWMTQNLRYKGDTGSASNSMTVKAATTNVNADTAISYTDLTSSNTYNAARIHVATSDQVPSGATYTATDMGIWYNYAAASAMTITGSSNSTADTYNLCPKNWTLPTDSQQSGIASSTYKDAFSPVTGGYYNTGSLSTTGRGYWWSATAYNTTIRYYLRYNGSSLDTDGYYGRSYGFYVRCIRTS